jgi:hypothetical protein
MNAGCQPLKATLIVFVASAILSGCSAQSSLLGQTAVSSSGVSMDQRNGAHGSVYVASNGSPSSVSVFPVGASNPSRSIIEGVDDPAALALNKSRLIVANGRTNDSHGAGNDVSIFSHGGEKLIKTITKGIAKPHRIITDSSGNIYVANRRDVVVYAPGKSNPMRRIKILGPTSIALNVLGDLFIGTPSKVLVYQPSSNKPILTITQGISNAGAIAFDSSQNVYVANVDASGPSGGVGTVTVYSAGTSSLLYTISDGIVEPYALEFDSSGNLYVANSAPLNNQGNDITVYAPGTSSVLRSITNDVNNPVALAFDSSGDLYVVNREGNNVTVYAPGGNSALRTLSKGLASPSSITVSP